MSNPLSMFRKHQYLFLVVFGVMLMVAFIVLPPLDDYLRTQRGPGAGGDSLVVSWNGGRLKESELERLRLMHRMAVSYLFAVVQETQRREGTPRGVRQGQFGQVMDPGIPATMSDENLVHTHLLAAKGEAMGMVVSDEAIAEFLEQLSDETIQAQEMSVIFKEHLGGQFSLQQLLNQLRVELMAQRVRSMAEAGLYVAPYGTVPPVQAWDYFQRLNRRVKIEAVALDVDDYVSKVGEPTEPQLKTLYEEGKNRFPFPESPEPGFQQRRKAAFQFVRVDFNKFLEEEKAKVTITDEQIEKHYEENKDTRYRALDLPTAPGAGDASDGGEPPADAGDDTKPSTTQPPTEDDPAPTPPTDGAQPKQGTPADNGDSSDDQPATPQDDPAPTPPGDEPAKQDAPAAPKPTEEKPTEEKPTEEKPTEEKPTEEKPTEEKPTADEPAADKPAADEPTADEPAADEPAADPAEQGERQAGELREFFVTTQGDEVQPPEDASEPAKDPAGKDGTEDNPAGTAESKTEPAAAPGAEKPADAPSQPDGTAPGQAASPPTATATEGDDSPDSEPAEETASEKPANEVASPAEDEPPRVRPLDDELRQEIRDELTEIEARQPAQERVDQALAALRSRVTKLGREKRAELRAAGNDEDERGEEVEPAGPVDVTDLAAEHGLTVGQIPLVDAIEIKGAADGSTPGYELGDAFNMQFSPSFQMMRENFTDIAFAEDVRRYSPNTISGSESGIQFLYWKTDDEPPYVPDFAEARPAVEVAWKRIEARKVAVAEAKKLADELNQGEQTLQEKFADDDAHEVLEPAEFSWMTTGFNPSGAGTPMLSDIDGIENGGADLMKEIFSLEIGEVGSALNMPQSKVYLVRVVSDSPPEELLKQLFLTSGDSPEVQYIAYVESISLLRAWYEGLETEMGLTWHRDPIDAT